MQKYRLKQTYEAFRWTGDPAQIKYTICNAYIKFENVSSPDVTMLMEYPYGTFKVKLGDWIIYGSEGMIYSCDPNFFDTVYEEIVDIPPIERNLL